MSELQYYYTVEFNASDVSLTVTSERATLYVREWTYEMPGDTFTYYQNNVTLSCQLQVGMEGDFRAVFWDLEV